MDPKSNTIGIFTEAVPLISCPNCGEDMDVSEFQAFDAVNCPDCNHGTTVPARLGNYLLLSELGRGAMGCVYLALDESLGRYVALKVMRKEFGDDPEMLDKLQEEAKALAALNNLNVVQIYQFGREKGQPYFVMELLDGERVEDMMVGDEAMDESRALKIMADVAEGLAAAHSIGMTHGDIKPANILMDKSGVSKVVDFGLARFMSSEEEIELWGTPYYIPPEKGKREQEDARSDQYSLGATIFHLLAGKPPFDADEPAQVVVAAMQDPTPVLKEVREDIHEKTSAVIRRMMDKTPGRRFPTYASLQADIRDALAAIKAAEEERRLAEEAPPAAKAKPKKLTAMLMISAILIAVVGGGVAVKLRANQSSAGQRFEGRAVHAPFTKEESVQLKRVVQLLRAGRIKEMSETLNAIAAPLPRDHESRAWLSFFNGVFLLYAGAHDLAVVQFELARDQKPILYTAGSRPNEDPRLLAKIVLDEMDYAKAQKKVAKAAPYFRALSEVAVGSQRMLAGSPNDAARHFKGYAELRSSQVPWAFVLAPLMDRFHLMQSVNEQNTRIAAQFFPAP